MKDINAVGCILDDKGYYMVTHSGKKVSILAPSPDSILLSDIAHSLSLQCRYNGQVDRMYSVAEHTLKGAVIAMQEGDEELLKAWLLHDASEAYVGDIIRPVKVYLPLFKQIEEGFIKVLYEKFDTPRREEEVYRIDNIMCALEKENLLPNNTEVWQGLPDVSYYRNHFKSWGASDWKENSRSLLQLLEMYFGKDQ